MARGVRAPTLMSHMVLVEEQVAAMSMKMADVEKQIQAILTGITKASERTHEVAAQADKAILAANKATEAIAKMTKECQQLRVTTGKISQTQDRILTSLTQVEKSLEGL